MGTIIQASAGGRTSNIQVNRPRFSDLWKNYINGKSANEVYTIIGGKVQQLYNENPISYSNTCAIRMSRSLNYGGMPINKNKIPSKAYHAKGGDGHSYFFRVKDIEKFLELNFGKPELDIKTNGMNVSAQFRNKKGIIIFEVNFSDATGHVTLWEGAMCGDHCYFSSDNPEKIANRIKLWELK